MDDKSNEDRRHLDRDQLYEQVWAEPVTKVAARYGISDVALAKVCRKLDVPVPPRGYWRRLERGWQPARPPLSKRRPGIPCSVELMNRPPTSDGAPRSPEVEAQEAFEQQPRNRVRVPRRLVDPHPLVARTAERLRVAKPGKYGTVGAWGDKTLDVQVGPRSVERALRLMDALVKALEARGLRVGVASEGKD